MLRELGKFKESEAVYKRGLELFPESIAIQKNFANLLRHLDPIRALSIELSLVAEKFEKEHSFHTSDCISLVEILISLECYEWARTICLFAIDRVEINSSFLLVFLRLVSVYSNKNFRQDVDYLFRLIDQKLEVLPPIDSAELKFALSWLQCEQQDFDAALQTLEEARAILSKCDFSVTDDRERAFVLNNVNSWNIANALLPAQDFLRGWKLFEFGLCARAAGGQRWQRAMPKPFSDVQLPVWRGEDLSNKSILLLEEQAVGDVMQFMTLVPQLMVESRHVAVLLNNRLLSIYRRAFAKQSAEGSISFYSFQDVSSGNLNCSMFDYQSPIGSICQHRFTDIEKYGKSTQVLLHDKELATHYRGAYLGSGRYKQVVGVSWRGGGRDDRIKQKSISTDQFGKFLSRFDDIQFVSLQYGESESCVKRWQELGVNIIYDSSVNPLKNMDSWLSQVAACDSVISVANTTIHGSGGLGIPTMCFLSNQSDWRWLKNPAVERSYWYPTVGIARQALDGSWTEAFATTEHWLKSGSPMPQGLQYI